MTQEEKARAYDEALNKAKIEINTKGIGETVNLCKQLFPELFESEDENLKNKSGYYKAGKFWKASTLWNATKNKIPQRVSNRYILQECTWNIGTLQRFADEVKNVQEVSLDYPIILDMNGNIIDGAHRVVKAYLEGKDIDIVYIGDDEWPEPDYDEEKAVKESNDERIRKYLIEELKATKSVGELKFIIPQPTREECIAYLEKQKEEEGYEAIPVESTLEYKLGFKAGKDSEKQKEQKPSELEQLTKLREMTHEIREAYERGIEVGRAEQKSAEKQDYSGLNDLEKVIHRGFLSAGVENAPITIIKKTAQECLTQMKPTEWSEEDEQRIAEIEFAVMQMNTKRVDTKDKCLAWLKNLPERFNLPQTQEWSEGDEKQIAQIERICKNAGCSKMLQEKIHNWFDSLCFKIVKWDTDMMNIRNSIRDILYKEKRCPNAWFTYLEHCGPQTKYAYWKPSEEQMKALKNSAYGAYQNGDGPALRELYEQLEKL